MSIPVAAPLRAARAGGLFSKKQDPSHRHNVPSKEHLSTGPEYSGVPVRQFHSKSPPDTFVCVAAPALSMREWVKALRKERGYRSQEALAEAIGVQRSAVAKWEMKKNPQQPERESYFSLYSLASTALRARAPQIIDDLPAVSDPDRSVRPNAKGTYFVTSDQGKIIARKFDAMPEEERDEALRKCLNVLAGEAQDFLEPGAERKRHSARPNR